MTTLETLNAQYSTACTHFTQVTMQLNELSRRQAEIAGALGLLKDQIQAAQAEEAKAKEAAAAEAEET